MNQTKNRQPLIRLTVFLDLDCNFDEREINTVKHQERLYDGKSTLNDLKL